MANKKLLDPIHPGEILSEEFDLRIAQRLVGPEIDHR
jgi:plasmid maintenance system antidote protein VapI